MVSAVAGPGIGRPAPNNPSLGLDAIKALYEDFTALRCSALGRSQQESFCDLDNAALPNGLDQPIYNLAGLVLLIDRAG